MRALLLWKEAMFFKTQLNLIFSSLVKFSSQSDRISRLAIHHMQINGHRIWQTKWVDCDKKEVPNSEALRISTTHIHPDLAYNQFSRTSEESKESTLLTGQACAISIPASIPSTTWQWTVKQTGRLSNTTYRSCVGWTLKTSSGQSTVVERLLRTLPPSSLIRMSTTFQSSWTRGCRMALLFSEYITNMNLSQFNSRLQHNLWFQSKLDTSFMKLENYSSGKIRLNSCWHCLQFNN